MLYYHLGLFIPRVLQVRAINGGGKGYSFGDDFYPIWLTTRQWRIEHRDLYSPAMTREIQIGLFGRALDPRNPNDPPVEYRQFAYPAFADLILWPAALIDFPTLRVMLAILLPLLTIASIRLWMIALGCRLHPLGFIVIALLTLCTYEVLEGLFAEQPGLFVGYFLASAAVALRKNHLMLAGILTSLTLIKPQVTLLAVLYLLLWSLADRGRARFWVGFLAVTICLMAGSVWIWPRWVAQWISILLGYHRYAMPPLISMLLGPRTNAYVGPVIIAGLLVASLVVAWRNRNAAPDSPNFWLTLSLLLAVTSVALLPGQAIYDHIILIPGILLLLRSRRELREAGRVSRAMLSAGALVLFWPWFSAFALLAVRPWIGDRVFFSTAVFTLPIRTAASLPFAVLALLAWTMRINPAPNQESA